MDEGYEPELRSLTDDPSKALDMGTASSETRQRSAKLYGVLASLVKNRALSIVRAAPAGDGYEALRQLTLTLRPNIQSRGLALLTNVTGWPSFAMSKPFPSQVLTLEEAFDETRRAGTTLADELKTAILLRCISGSLKTHLNLNIKEGTKYLDVREEVLRWDREKRSCVGIERNRNGVVPQPQLMTAQMQLQWKLLGLREKENMEKMPRVSQRTRVLPKERERTRAKTRVESQKVERVQRASQRISRAKAKVGNLQRRVVTFVASRVTLQKIVGIQ